MPSPLLAPAGFMLPAPLVSGVQQVVDEMSSRGYIGLGGSVAALNIAADFTIPLDTAGNGKVMAEQVLISNAVFTPVSPIDGGNCSFSLVGNGTNTPNLSAFNNANGYVYNSAAGYKNIYSAVYTYGKTLLYGVGVGGSVPAPAPPAPTPSPPAPAPAPTPAPAVPDTRPRFGLGPVGGTAPTQSALAAIFNAMQVVPGSANGTHAGAFAPATTSTTYGWVAVIASNSTSGVTFFDGLGTGGWGGAGLAGSNPDSPFPDPSVSAITYTDATSNVWRMFRQDLVNQSPTGNITMS